MDIPKNNEDNTDFSEVEHNQVKTILDLLPDRREIERVRVTMEMSPNNVGSTKYSYAPIEFVVPLKYAVTFVDLVQASTPIEKLSIIIESALPQMKVDPVLAQRINSGKSVNVKGGYSADTTIVVIRYDQSNNHYYIKFGYSSCGTSVEQKPEGDINVTFNEQPDEIIDESLYRLFELTGKIEYLKIMGVRHKMKTTSTEQGKIKKVDDQSYYALLGLNPYSLKFMPENIFEAAVKGIKTFIVKALHPDATGKKLDTFEVEFFTKMLEAAEVLSNKEQRDRYTTWLK